MQDGTTAKRQDEQDRRRRTSELEKALVALGAATRATSDLSYDIQTEGRGVLESIDEQLAVLDPSMSRELLAYRDEIELEGRTIDRMFADAEQRLQSMKSSIALELEQLQKD